jgi:hypothetical protein
MKRNPVSVIGGAFPRQHRMRFCDIVTETPHFTIRSAPTLTLREFSTGMLHARVGWLIGVERASCALEFTSARSDELERRS